jgi:lipooligosaccharide transport system permease protein
LLFGMINSPLALVAIGAGTLTGLAFAAPIFAFTATRGNDSGFAALTRFIITPLFLFGGAFFPVTRLPLPLQVVAELTPLYHGVELSRGATLGTLSAGPAALHLAVLLAYIGVGTLLAGRNLRRRLLV